MMKMKAKFYINKCINDYVRILSTGAMENVEVIIDGKVVSMDTDVNTDIISMLPALQQDVDNLSINNDFIDNILTRFDINKDNLCLNKDTKNLATERTKRDERDNGHYYYNPDGYLKEPATL